MTKFKFREHDPDHPYVRRLVGCGHGRLLTDPCVECEIVRLHDDYRRAAGTIQVVRDRLRELGAPFPAGFTGKGESA